MKRSFEKEIAKSQEKISHCEFLGSTTDDLELLPLPPHCIWIVSSEEEWVGLVLAWIYCMCGDQISSLKYL
jgi:hypothetical protein